MKVITADNYKPLQTETLFQYPFLFNPSPSVSGQCFSGGQGLTVPHVQCKLSQHQPVRHLQRARASGPWHPREVLPGTVSRRG